MSIILEEKQAKQQMVERMDETVAESGRQVRVAKEARNDSEKALERLRAECDEISEKEQASSREVKALRAALATEKAAKLDNAAALVSFESKLKGAAEAEAKLKAEVQRLSAEAAAAVEALVAAEEKLTAALPSDRVRQEEAETTERNKKELQEAKFATNTLRAKLTESEGQHRADSIELADVRSKLVAATSELAATKNDVWELTSAAKAQADSHAQELSAGQHVLEGARRETSTLAEQVSDNATASEVLKARVTSLEENLTALETEKVTVCTTLETVQMELDRSAKALVEASKAQRKVHAGDGDSVVIAKYLDHHNRHDDVTMIRLEKGSYRLLLKDGTKHKLTVRVNGESVYIRKGGGWQGLEDWLGRHASSAAKVISAAAAAAGGAGAGAGGTTGKPKVPIPTSSTRKQLPPKPPVRSRTTSPSRRLPTPSPSAKKTSRKGSVSSDPPASAGTSSAPASPTRPAFVATTSPSRPATSAASKSGGTSAATTSGSKAGGGPLSI